MQLDGQFYDQLQQRLNRQDEALSRIEQGQSSLLTCMQEAKKVHLAHTVSDESNFYWIKWVLGGVWVAILSLATILIKS